MLEVITLLLLPLLRRRGVAVVVLATRPAAAVEIDRRILHVAHGSFVLPRPVLRVLRLDARYDGGVGAAAAAVVGARGAVGGLDCVAGAAAGGDVAVALEDFLCGDVAGVVEEGGVVEDGLEVFGYLVVSLVCLFSSKKEDCGEAYLTHLVVELYERVHGLNG